MPLTDMPLEELRAYRPAVAEPEDFDGFWTKTLTAAGEAGRTAAPAEYRRPAVSPLRTVDVHPARLPSLSEAPPTARPSTMRVQAAKIS